MTERKRNILIWALLIAVSAVSAWFVVAGKMEYMEREYADYNAAKAAGELEKGWLPGFLPEGATDIKVINNTDKKSSLAAFRYEGNLDLGGCKEAPLSDTALPPERVVLWWPDELTGKGAVVPGNTYYRCADGQAVVNASMKEVYFWK